MTEELSTVEPPRYEKNPFLITRPTGLPISIPALHLPSWKWTGSFSLLPDKAGPPLTNWDLLPLPFSKMLFSCLLSCIICLSLSVLLLLFGCAHKDTLIFLIINTEPITSLVVQFCETALPKQRAQVWSLGGELDPSCRNQDFPFRKRSQAEIKDSTYGNEKKRFCVLQLRPSAAE